jgi:4-hydroxybutyrate CoA-transferase
MMIQQIQQGEASWKDVYRNRLCTAEEALAQVRSGDHVYIHSNAAAPNALIGALVNRAPELRDVSIFHLLTLGNAEYASEKYAGSFRVHALFIGPNVREAVNAGRADYTPVFLSEIPNMFTSKVLPIDVCLLQVSPPDEHGYCSYGVSVDCTIGARKNAKLVIAQVNENMPRTMGRSFVHVGKFDYIVEADAPLPELHAEPPSEVEHEIGKNVAELIEDGATLQLGIGAIPNAILHYLDNKRELGLHTEMFSDGVVDLIEKGVITNDRKTVLPGKSTVSFVMGSKRLYDYVHNNPSVEFQPSDFVNDPFIISQNYRMTAVNSALEVDLTGQVSADSVGKILYSGVGGQVDFIRGAARAKEGKAIIALPATAKNGTLSRIVARVSGGVVTSRADVHYVVTEFGIAQLYGKSLKERAQALIQVAHPKFRAELEEQCSKTPWLAF